MVPISRYAWTPQRATTATAGLVFNYTTEMSVEVTKDHDNIQLFNNRDKVKIKISQMWTNALPLESVHKLASIDSAPTNVTVSTATKRSFQWEILIMFFQSLIRHLDLNQFLTSRTQQQGVARLRKADQA